MQAEVRDDHHVQLLVGQALEHGVPAAVLQGQVGLRVHLLKQPEIVRDALLGIRPMDAQAQVPLLPIGDGAGLLHRPGILRQNALALPGKKRPGGGELHAAAAPLEELKAQLLLKLFDLLTDGRLGHKALPGGFGKVQVFGHG